MKPIDSLIITMLYNLGFRHARAVREPSLGNWMEYTELKQEIVAIAKRHGRWEWVQAQADVILRQQGLVPT